MINRAKLLFDLIGDRTLSRFEERCQHPMREQETLLRKMLEENATTRFGQAHGFDAIEAFSGYQKRVPITEYDDLQRFIEAEQRGEPDQLTHQQPTFYAMTSGTTGAKKYIPVTERSRRAKADLMRIWLAGLFRDHHAILDGKVLMLVGAEVEEHAPDGTPCGSEGGHAYRNMPGVMRGLYPVPYEVCEIDDYAARYYLTLRIALMHSIRAIGTPNPSTILLLCHHLAENTEGLLRDIRDGTVDASLELEPELREQLESLFEPDPDRARELERSASAEGRILPRDAWPDMEALACWKGGTVNQYLEQLAPYFPEGLPARDLGWFSSECRGTVPLGDDGDSGALAVATNVFEFYPADAEDEPSGTDLLTLDQLEEGRQYLVYVTTWGGLYRYAMHDILEVTGFYGATPTVRFVQKEKGITNFTGEKLTETQVLAAAAEVLPEGNGASFIAAVGRAAEHEHDVPSYLFLVEYDGTPDPGSCQRAAHQLDEALGRHNTEYASKRKSGRLGAAVLRALESGQLDAFLRQQLRQGGKDGQTKLLRLTDDLSFVDRFDRVVADFRGD